MTLHIGRAGTDVPLSIAQWDETNGRVRVAVRLRGVGMRRAAQVRDQIMGYISSPDEPVVPVINTDDPSVDGYYRVIGVTSVPHRTAAYLGYVTLNVELQRVPGFAAPLLELHSLGAIRANTRGISAGYLQPIRVPEAAKSVGFLALDIGTWIPFAPDIGRSSATGDVLLYQMAQIPYLTQFFLDPRNHYDAAATLMMGDDLVPVVGRQVRNQPNQWRISNGLLELEPLGDRFGLQCRMYLFGQGWSDWVPFTFVDATGSGSYLAMMAPHSITVVRNSPTEVIVRLLTTTTQSVGEYSPVTVDIALKRGSRVAEVQLHSVFTGTFGISGSVFAGATDENWYWYKTLSNVRMFVTGPMRIGQQGNVLRPDESGVTSVAAWALGVGIADDAASSPDDAETCALEYFWASSQRQAVVVQ